MMPVIQIFASLLLTLQDMKKVIIVGPAYPYRGGIAAFSERLAKELSSEGCEVELHTFTLQYPSFLFPGETQFSTGPAPEGLAIMRTLNSVNPVSWFREARRIRRETPDMVIFAFWLPYMAPCFGTVARFARRSGRKIEMLGLVHNLVPHEKHPGDRMLARYFSGAMDRFLTMSKSVLEDVRTLAPAKPASFSPHPLYDNFGERISREEACSHLGIDPACTYFLFFGLVRAYKGLDLLLEAMADPALASDPSVKLIVAGEFYGDGTKYKEMEEALGLKGKVIWRSEFIPDSQVHDYFCAADLVVQPYKSATQSGITQIAYHFERPMLVTDVGGLSEVVPDGKVGYCVNPAPSDIAVALNDFKSRRPDFSAGLAQEKKKYSWSRMAGEVLRK